MFKIDNPESWLCPECNEQPVQKKEHKDMMAIFENREQSEIKCDGCMEDLMAECNGDEVEFVEMWAYD